jgi:hypothetical protein
VLRCVDKNKNPQLINSQGFNTLAQSGTANSASTLPSTLILGDGTDLSDNASVVKRAKRKVITNKMILSLIDVANEKGEYDRAKQYWNAFHCQNEVTVFDNRLYGKYCKNRFCTICTAIRKAEIINKYYPTISQWENPHFVTLTVKACKAERLDVWVKKMYKGFDLIHGRCKKRNQRGKGIKLIGVKSLECNFNPIKKTYNPHFHIIVPNAEVATLLRQEWIEQWKPTRKANVSYNKYKYASPAAQDIRKINDLEHALIETIKYGSKIFTEPDLKKKSLMPKDHMIYASALHNIFTAMQGKRLFDRFGFNLSNQANKSTQSNWVNNYEKWQYSTELSDWINESTDEPLTGYTIPIQLRHLLSECINTELY